METQKRSVRIYLAMTPDGPLAKAVKAVIPTFGNEAVLSYVDTLAEADLIIFTDVLAIERDYDPAKRYAYLQLGSLPAAMPRICRIINPAQILVGLIEAIRSTQESIASTEEVQVPPQQAEVPLRPDALSILVVDDTSKHIESAKAGLAGHRLTTATGYEQAMDILGEQTFDVVLVDLQLPMSSKGMGMKFKLGELVHYGVLLVLEAARQGAKYAAVVTDASHHDDPFSAAFDHFRNFEFHVEGTKVRMMHAVRDANGAKDWNVALRRLMEEDAG